MLAQESETIPKRESSISQAPPKPETLSGIGKSVRALLIPSASLYFKCNQERIHQHQSQVAALDLQLECVRKRAFAAAVKLMALAGSKPSGTDQPDSNAGEALS